MSAWGDLVARTRGLGTHLLQVGQLERAARAADFPALGRVLAELDFRVGDAVTPRELELAVRRSAAARLRTLVRWLNGRGESLAVLLGDEDRRSLRALLRGAVAGVAPEARLAGLIPTPSLPERALQELARQPGPAPMAALLIAWKHPFGQGLAEAAGPGTPDLLRLELALNRAWAARAVTGTRHAPRSLRNFVAEAIDLQNAATTLLLAGQETELVPEEVFLAGGKRVDLTRFLRAARSGSPAAAALELAPSFGPALAEVIRRSAGDPARLDDRALGARRRALRAEARLDPIGPAPVLCFLLDLRAQVIALHRIIWDIGLGVPQDLRVAALSGAA